MRYPCTNLLWLLFVLLAVSPLRADFTPQPDNATLEYDGKTLKPTEFREGAELEKIVNGRRFLLREDSLLELDKATGQKTWSVQSPQPLTTLRWLAVEGATIYLQPQRIEQSKASLEPELQLSRLDIEKKKWLDPLPLPAEKAQEGTQEYIVSAAAGTPGLLVLTERSVEDPKVQRKITGRRLTLFRDGKQLWTKTFPAPEPLPTPGVMLLAAPKMPDYANSSIHYLTWIGDTILFCGGDTADILCLDSDGKTKWRIRRLWEFERGFIGPSVWSHFIARFGDDDGPLGENESELQEAPPSQPLTDYQKAAQKRSAELAADFQKHFRGAITAGPIVAYPAKQEKGATPSIFVAVAKGPADWQWGYLAETTVYEITVKGRIIAMTKLPRNIEGSHALATSGGLIWTCQKNAMVRLGLAEDRGISMGMDNDHACPINWYREFQPAQAAAFLRAGPVYDLVAFNETSAYRTVAGGYVPADDHHVYRFPITIIDLKNGQDRTATLSVPIKGDLPIPTSNYSSSNGNFTLSHPYKLGITQLQRTDSSLRITLGTEATATTLTFPIDK